MTTSSHPRRAPRVALLVAAALPCAGATAAPQAPAGVPSPSAAAPAPAPAPTPAPAVAAAATASSAAVLTLDAAIARALERSEAVLLAAGGREVAAARLREARAWTNPTLVIDAEDVFGEGQFAGFDAGETTVALQQPLQLGGARGARIRGARAGANLADIDAMLAARELRRDVTIAYAEAVAAERLAALGRERARIGAESLAAVSRRFAAGLESDLQRARAEVETSGLRAAARRASAEVAARRRALAALWRDEPTVEPLDEAWFDRPRSAGAEAVSTASDADAHPRLVRARLAVDRARAALEEARAARFGNLQATVGTRSFGDQPADGNRAMVLGLQVPLPLWDRNVGGIAEARAALAAAELEVERTARELAAEREAAAAERDAAMVEVEGLVSQGLPAAASAARLAAQGYDAGRIPLLERLVAERDLTELRERLERARLDLRRAEARLDSLR
jgi:cobalt-zinc-cadmium efflux system outer membrane protein